jgi:hypothetical protein
VAAQANILPAIGTEVSADTLHIEGRDDFTTTESVTVIVIAPVIDRIEVGGGAQAQADGLDVTALEVVLRGGARFSASGVADDLTVSLDGGSTAFLGELVATRVHAEVDGGSAATILARDAVSGTALAGAQLTVLGGPRVDVRTSGGATVSSR